MRLLPVLLFTLSCAAWGQELNNPNNLPPCPTGQNLQFHDCWGMMTWPNGDEYIGEFKNGYKHGLGTYYHLADSGHKGEKYIGEFENGDFYGLGTYLWPEGHSHRGYFKNMKPDGKGIKIFKDGTKFQGVFSDWSEGIVVITKLNGTKYVGEIKAQVPQGRGKLSFKNGSWFDGIFQGKSLIEGELLYYNSEKSTYLEGIWKDNKLIRSEKVGLTALVDERSLIYNPLEDEKRALDAYKPYTENFTENIAEDENFIHEAKVEPPEKDMHEAKVEPPNEDMNVAASVSILQDVNNTNKLPMCPSGQHTRLYCWGTYYLSNGDKYVGEFKDGAFHGQGTLMKAGGKSKEGIWENGRFIHEAKVNIPWQNKIIATDADRFNLTDFETECQRIGFMPKTEKFGECVMDLYKRRAPTGNQKSAQSPSAPSASKDKFVLECTKMGFREGTPDSSNCALSLRRHDAEMNLHQQQLETYQQQVDQAEKVNRLAATQRLLEIANQGFGMASGNSFTPSLRSIGPLPPPPAPLQFVSPGGNRYTCAYSGVQLVCR
jgi:hypothetical protein